MFLSARKAGINYSPSRCQWTHLTLLILSIFSRGVLSAPFSDSKFLRVLDSRLFHTTFRVPMDSGKGQVVHFAFGWDSFKHLPAP